MTATELGAAPIAIIYRVDEGSHTVTVVDIDHRRDVYRT
jgi:mRNA-degrading endonuclease RelE of RelBE toxin-antitoxin system